MNRKFFTEENGSYLSVLIPLAILFIVVLMLLCFLTGTCSAAPFNECQLFIIDHWPRYNFSALAVANMDVCEVKVTTLADANEIAEIWINGTAE